MATQSKAARSKTVQSDIVLNDGTSIPQLGFGVWQVPPGDVEAVVGQALAAGYRSVDTAAAYNNEDGVGAALATQAGAGVYLTTKLWNDSHGYDASLRAFDASLGRLKRDAVDLYLIHWPSPRKNLFVDSWRALIRLRDEGRAKSIGVSNFTIANLSASSTKPESFRRSTRSSSIRASNSRRCGIFTHSTASRPNRGARSAAAACSTIRRSAPSPQSTAGRRPRSCCAGTSTTDLIVIPKSVTPARIRENVDVFDFALDGDDLAKIAALDDAKGRVGPDPDTASF